jgi:hypothetical protein
VVVYSWSIHLAGFEFLHRRVEFFVIDTRSRRNISTDGDAARQIDPPPIVAVQNLQHRLDPARVEAIALIVPTLWGCGSSDSGKSAGLGAMLKDRAVGVAEGKAAYTRLSQKRLVICERLLSRFSLIAQEFRRYFVRPICIETRLLCTLHRICQM